MLNIKKGRSKMEAKIEKVNDKVNNIDKNLSVLSERLLNFLDKIEDLEKNLKEDNLEVNCKIDGLKQEIKELKLDLDKIKTETAENSRNRKLTNNVVWFTFTSIIALGFYIIKHKLFKS